MENRILAHMLGNTINIKLALMFWSYRFDLVLLVGVLLLWMFFVDFVVAVVFLPMD